MNHRFFLAMVIYNLMVKEAYRRMNAYKRDPAVKEVWKKWQNKKYKRTKEDRELLKAKRAEYGLSEYSFHKFLTVQAQKNAAHLDSNTIQRIGSAVWASASAMLFKHGEKMHFKKYDDMLSLEGKTNKSGICYRDGFLSWLGLQIPAKVRNNDIYAQYALTNNRIKYCRIVREWHNNHYEFCLQIVFEGTPPPKLDRETGEFARKTAPQGNVGIDIGPSTIMAYSDKAILFCELGDTVRLENGDIFVPNGNVRKRIDETQAQIEWYQQEMDKLRRLNNPQYFDEKGQIKRMKKGSRRQWHDSNRYRRYRNKVKTLYKKRKVYLRESQEILANQILSMGNHITVEKMSFSGLAKRSKKTKINEKTGLPASKKRFGKSVGIHGPAQQISIIERKAPLHRAEVIRAETAELKASQYNHIDDSYTKASLNERAKELASGVTVHRDPYSGFLLYSVSDGQIDRECCIKHFDEFRDRENRLYTYLTALQAQGIQFPECMGI